MGTTRKKPREGVPDALTGVRARDLMHTKVVTLRADASAEEAIRTLEENEISGAPVIDARGRLVGVLSARDIAQSEHVGEGRLQGSRGEYRLSESGEESEEAGWDEESELFSIEDYSPGVLGGETARDWMNPRIISVGPDATLKEICQVMARESIHRLVVLDRERLAGILSTSDVIRCLAERL